MSFRAYLRPAKRAANRLFEALWALGFAALGRLGRSQPARWSPGGHRSVLVVAPHPDDEVIGCVGTILRHRQAGDEVCVAIVTDGRQSRAIADPDQMAAERQREARAAARLMGVERLAWLGHPEGDCSVTAIKKSLSTLLAQTQPDLLYAPSRVDFHPEHLKVAHALALALAEVGGGVTPLVRIYQIQVPLTAPLCNLVTDVSPLTERCESVLATYSSQLGSLQGTRRQRRYAAALHGYARQAEEFWEIPANRYVALHSATPRNWAAAFRGVRNFSLSDPLAYLVGCAERRRLRQAV
jgi:LmbE family N-acetylglucosaminyl deacetylase